MDMSIKSPLVSVVMPVYNGEYYLSEAVRSILTQSFTDFEFLIIDDGSTDKTFDLIEQYARKDSRVRVFRNTTNLGLATSLNIGLKLSRGSLIARMDADDVAMPHRLSNQSIFMQNNSKVTVCGSALETYEQPGKNWIPPLTHEAIKVMMLFECCMYHPTIIFRKNAIFNNNGGYDNQFSGAEDYELWYRLSKVSSVCFANIAEPLIRYRTHIGNDRSQYKKKQQRLANLVRRKQLNRLGIYPNNQEFSLHEAFSYSDYKPFKLIDLENYREWLNRIEDANMKFHVFSPFHLRHELKTRWLNLCLHTANQHPLVAVKFFLSRWSSNSVNNIYNVSRMFWRSRKYWKNYDV